jgi:hypothetical protein
MTREEAIGYAVKTFNEIKIRTDRAPGMAGCLSTYIGVLLFSKYRYGFVVANWCGIIGATEGFWYKQISNLKTFKMDDAFSFSDLHSLSGFVFKRKSEPHLDALFASNGFGDYQIFPESIQKKNNSQWNDVCKSCGAPSYVSLFSVECSNNCKGEKK